MENRPGVVTFLPDYKDTLEILWGSTIKDVQHLSINMLLYREVLKFAIQNQHWYFELSSKASGAFRFKQRWAAKQNNVTGTTG